MSVENQVDLIISKAEEMVKVIIAIEGSVLAQSIERLNANARYFSPRSMNEITPQLKCLIHIYLCLNSLNKDLIFCSPPVCQWEAQPYYSILIKYIDVVRAVIRKSFVSNKPSISPPPISYGDVSLDPFDVGSSSENDMLGVQLIMELDNFINLKQNDFVFNVLDFESYYSWILAAIASIQPLFSDLSASCFDVKQAHASFAAQLINEISRYPTTYSESYFLKVLASKGDNSEDGKITSQLAASFLIFQKLQKDLPATNKLFEASKLLNIIAREYSVVLSKENIVRKHNIIRGKTETEVYTQINFFPMTQSVINSMAPPQSVALIHIKRILFRLIPNTEKGLMDAYLKLHEFLKSKQ